MDDLKIVTTTYINVVGITRNALSLAIYGGNNRNRIKRIFDTNRMEVGCFEETMQWFSDNWPETTEWPTDIARPDRSTEPSDVSIREAV